MYVLCIRNPPGMHLLTFSLFFPQRRIKRAIDLSSKHIDMPKELQEDPWREYAYVQRVMIATQKEKDEKATLNGKWWMPFHLGREPWYAYNTKNAYFWKGPEKKKVLGKA